MQQIISWLLSNHKWLFDGVGGLMLMGVIGWVFRFIFSDENKNQTQKSGGGSINLQSGLVVWCQYGNHQFRI